MSAHPKLTEAVEAKILVWIRGGAFPHVAAAAEGIPYDTFQRWMTVGLRRSPRAPARYRRFAHHVQQATAVGRMRAEIALRAKDPKTWLLSGPGKEKPDRPGWSSAPRAPTDRKDRRDGSSPDPQLTSLIEELLGALEFFPDARQAAAAALERLGRAGEEAPYSARSRLVPPGIDGPDGLTADR